MEGRIIEIDGSQGEGGGQILRTTVGLAAALGLDVRIVNIRSRRPKPGLGHQHLSAVRAAAAICGGRIIGDHMGSTDLSFHPSTLHGGRHEFDIGTAGSANLILQTVLPGLILSGEDAEVVVTGGTHNPMAPCFEYLRDVFALLASSMGIEMYLEMERAGFYPAGGGRIKMMVRGAEAMEDLDPVRCVAGGKLVRIEGLSAATTQLPEHIVQRQAQQIRQRLAAAGHPVEVRQERWDTFTPGTVVFLRGVFSRSVCGFFALGKRGKPAEQVADEAVDELLDHLVGGGALDVHAADQMITLAALCTGVSRFTCRRLTSHLRTNAQVIRELTGRDVELIETADCTGTVTVGEVKHDK